jgi:hypothetical protein
MALAKRFSGKTQTVKGRDLPGPKFTGWAWIYFALYVALPVLALGLLLDIVFYFAAAYGFGSCYAILCLFD